MLKCDPRAFARCPYNKTCAPIEEATFTEGSDCDLYNQKVLRTPLTNADRIRAMSDEELADYLSKMCVCTPGGDCHSISGDCKACWLELLQQPAEEVPDNG